jgi:hypothetical protein
MEWCGGLPDGLTTSTSTAQPSPARHGILKRIVFFIGKIDFSSCLTQIKYKKSTPSHAQYNSWAISFHSVVYFVRPSLIPFPLYPLLYCCLHNILAQQIAPITLIVTCPISILSPLKSTNARYRMLALLAVHTLHADQCHQSHPATSTVPFHLCLSQGQPLVRRRIADGAHPCRSQRFGCAWDVNLPDSPT